MAIKLGLQLWNQVYSWPETRDAVVRAEALGYNEIWTWEHAVAAMEGIARLKPPGGKRPN